ncbi:FCS-Like Zinc finger 3-like [Miscanthus floridulus]|uniref:FCS-Like Zinc finger 3-like n=1 Tax=Miscanthus floridulus TaxID=154761 RepID=UPI003457F33D
MEEVRYEKVASRFFLAVGKGNAGGDHRHFLDACFLCKRDITSDRHIFMYKGDAAFCSDDCRQEQRGMDAALKAARRRHRQLRRTASLPASSSSAAAYACTANKAATTGNWNIAVGEGFF